MRLGRLDRSLAELLRALPDLPARAAAQATPSLLARAELHGVGGVAFDAMIRAGVPLDAALVHGIEAREMARELDHAAHLAVVRAIDRALAAAGIEGVLLKGPLFAMRFYPRPAARATSDVDLLVRERDLATACEAMTDIGYVVAEGPEEERFRREHHHLHLSHPHAPALELHFHAYRGLGRILPSEPLVDRSRPAPLAGLTNIGVLEASDELVYLAVHAAAHRFVRLGWLLDILWLARSLSEPALAAARTRAASFGYARALAYAAGLAAEQLGLARNVAERLGHIGVVRHAVVDAACAEPRSRLLASATRLVYTAALCDDRAAAMRYARAASSRHVRELLGRAS